MYLGFLKEFLFHPDEEHIINKSVNIRGHEVLLLSFTKENNRGSLWVINKRDLPEKALYELEFNSRRDDMLYHIESKNRNSLFFINKMEMQGMIIEFDSCSYYYFDDYNIHSIIKLLHFVELGLIPDQWDDLELENLVIVEYKEKEGDTAPNIDEAKNPSITLHIGRDVKQVPILHSFKTKIGEFGPGEKIAYYDKELGKEAFFYINKVGYYDIYKDIEDKVKIIEDVKERERILNDLIKGLENYCPRDKNLAFIEYETEDGTQLEFYLKDYLDSRPAVQVYDETVIGRSVGFGFIAKPDREKGINGHKLRVCIMQPVDKDFSGELEIELFSRYQEILEEVVIVS